MFGRNKVQVATGQRYNHDFENSHVTSMGFFHPQPVYNFETVPNSKHSVDVDFMSRFFQMAAPAYIQSSMQLRAFFVPYRVILKRWNEFITQSPCVDGVDARVGVKIISCCSIYNNELAEALYGNTLFMTEVSAAAQSDVYVQISSTSAKYYKFTERGRYLFKILQSLGLGVNWRYDDEHEIGLMPLVAYARVIYDYYVPTHQGMTNDYFAVKGFFDNDMAKVLSSYHLTTDQLNALLTLISNSYYGHGYLEDALVTPFADGNSANAMAINNPDENLDYAYYSAGSSSQATLMNAQDNVQFSDFGLKAITALTNFVMRNHLSGIKPIQRILSRFGVNVPQTLSDQSIYIGKFEAPVSVQDVESNADTGVGLGYLGGKAGNKPTSAKFSYDTDEFGQFIIIANLKLKTSVPQAYDRACEHVSPMNFYNPEFDVLGPQGINKREVFLPMNGNNLVSQGLASGRGDLFGYQRRYIEYISKRDQLTGYFNIPQAGLATYSAYQPFRNIANFVSGTHSGDYDKLVAGPAFINATERATQDFSKFFFNGDLYDCSTALFVFNSHSYSPVKPLYETFMFGEPDSEHRGYVNNNGHMN